VPNGNPISGGGGLPMMARLADGSDAQDQHDEAARGAGCGCPACRAATTSDVKSLIVSSEWEIVSVSKAQRQEPLASNGGPATFAPSMVAEAPAALTEDISSSGTDPRPSQPAVATDPLDLIDTIFVEDFYLFAASI
jgi:hypothetical protein